MSLDDDTDTSELNLDPDLELDDHLDFDIKRAIDLGTFTVDELAALCPERVDLLGGTAPEAGAGARSLVARGLVRLVVGDDGVVEPVSNEELVVAASFLAAPDRTLLLTREDALGTETYALFGQAVDDEGMSFVVEMGTIGIRRLLFVVPDQVIWVVSTLVGLADVAERHEADADASESIDVDVAALDPEAELAKALDQPVHLVSAIAADADGALIETSFVHGEDDAWICEWSGPSTARITPLREDTVVATLTRMLR